MSRMSPTVTTTTNNLPCRSIKWCCPCARSLVDAGLELNRQGSPQEGGSEEYDESFWDELDKVVEAVSVHQPHQQHDVLQQHDLQQQQQPQQHVSSADARNPEQFGAPLPTDYAASAPATTHAAALQPDHSGHASGHEAGTNAGEQRPLVLFGQTDFLVGAAARCTMRSFASFSMRQNDLLSLLGQR